MKSLNARPAIDWLLRRLSHPAAQISDQISDQINDQTIEPDDSRELVSVASVGSFKAAPKTSAASMMPLLKATRSPRPRIPERPWWSSGDRR
jgi:hypothetical protein